MRRRDFLRLSAGFGAACLLGARSARAAPGDTVIVIGAGMAGLAAADRLRRAGRQVIVIEARLRIGGRVWTAAKGIDLGASWIHGVTGNPISALALRAGAAHKPFDYDSMLRYDAAGAQIPDATDAWIDAAAGRLTDRIAVAQENASVDASLAGAVNAFTARQPASRRELVRHMVNTELVHEYAADPARLSLWYFDEGREFRGGDALFREGYAGVFRALLTPTELRLGERVREIDWSGSEVVVRTSKGVLSSARVLVTLPLGVLKSGGVTFTPGIPASKADAIRRLGMGTLDKIVLTFPRVAWPRSTRLFGHISGGDRRWEEWVNLVPFTGRPVLMGFNGGSVAVKLEARSDAAIRQSALSVLRRMFGPGLPSPTAVRITRWARDPYSRGSYSFAAAGSLAGDRPALAAPIDGRVFFAGEACSSDYPATVHGAYLSGLEAAGKILAV